MKWILVDTLTRNITSDIFYIINNVIFYAHNEPKSALARDLGDCRDNKGKLAKRVFTCCMSCILYTKFDTIPISQSDRSDRPETPIL